MGTKVPAYLQKLNRERAAQKQREEEEMVRRKDEPPPGYRVLAEEERVSTLQALLEKQEQLEQAYRKLPLKLETEGQKRRQRDLNAHLKEIEDNIAMLAKPRVLVKLDL